MNIPPPSNLGPLSEPWGREITKQVQENRIALERIGGDFSNDGSLNNSTLDNIAYQINELKQRQSGIVTAVNFSSPSFSSGMVTNVVTIQIPRPDVPRVGTVSLQFTATNSNGNQTEVYASMEIDGTVFHRDSRSVPTQNLEPPSWGGQKALTGFTGFTATPDSGGTLRLTLQAEAALSTGERSVLYSNIQANYQYGQAV
ncbi:hypothetical protein SEA_DEJAVU_56 [Microbacterium Phage DejaVu]|nr:hypothetical protein LUPINE_53 [Microbacterium phage Lupine]QDH92205.1 hypothetical protein SEA_PHILLYPHILLY_54 [Microbacterium phage PhillyPhilly]QDK03297.1 hypothetical protein SEA_ROMAN_55 [Microbacterium phage Roman]QIG58600.1 hypothetical protein SEA_HUBBS_55 [Microbacterium phage Hubbs]UVG34111.1 hypothetical protein SEA_PAVLO_54 [Microbacterium phage Pavlo]WNM66188.1 hypothetical protein SEA_DEJAVU_56 [Microbacterium Phage DejaVu]